MIAPRKDSPPRIACVGNMNNNMFAMMRYYRDLGLDAHLFLNEGEFAHFIPEADTWHIERWRPYIHQLPFGDNPRHLILRRSVTVRGALDGFDHIVGGGLNAAILYQAGRRMSIFCPYSTGIEWIGAQIIRGYRPTAMFHRFVRRAQKRATRGAANVVAADMTLETLRQLGQLGVVPHRLMLPMVYNEDAPDAEQVDDLVSVARRIRSAEFSVMAHARHHWLDLPADRGSFSANKRNDILLRAFGRCCREFSDIKPLLILCEYGRDVSVSKQLIRELGCESHVLWLPTMPRKKLRALMGLVSAVAGEFVDDGIWGGTGWEAMAAGKPLLQAVNLSPGEFRAATGAELPDVLHTRTTEDAYAHLERLYRDGPFREANGRSLLAWFDRYQGANLARQYLPLLGLAKPLQSTLSSCPPKPSRDHS